MQAFFEKYKALIGIVLLVLIVLGGGILIYREQVSTPIVFETADSSTAESASSGVIWVDIKGAVSIPGVYQMLDGDRVEDVILAAGGLTAEADLDVFTLSRAARVVDEQLVIVPKIVENTIIPASQPTTVSSGNCISINQASASELDSLPNIGEVRSNKIVDARPYQTFDELVSKQVLSQSVLDEIKDLICL